MIKLMDISDGAEFSLTSGHSDFSPGVFLSGVLLSHLPRIRFMVDDLNPAIALTRFDFTEDRLSFALCL